MKKNIFLVAFACATVLLSGCNGSSGSNGGSNSAVKSGFYSANEESNADESADFDYRKKKKKKYYNNYNKDKKQNSNQYQYQTQDQRQSQSYRANDPLLMQKKAGVSSQILYREGYVVSWNKDNRIPNWVAWHLTANHTTGSYKRGGIEFHEDNQADGPKVNTFDYARSGYDRGHMCPSGDNKWSKIAQQQSFLMTNMCPQKHNLNTGDWNDLEIQCREWAKRYGDIYIVTGPILENRQHKRIGQNKVVVPDAFFKVVLCTRGTPKAIGFIYRNESGHQSPESCVRSVDEIEKITGFDFFASLQDNIENRVEAKSNLKDWSTQALYQQQNWRSRR